MGQGKNGTVTLPCMCARSDLPPAYSSADIETLGPMKKKPSPRRRRVFLVSREPPWIGLGRRIDVSLDVDQVGLDLPSFLTFPRHHALQLVERNGGVYIVTTHRRYPISPVKKKASHSPHSSPSWRVGKGRGSPHVPGSCADIPRAIPTLYWCWIRPCRGCIRRRPTCWSQVSPVTEVKTDV